VQTECGYVHRSEDVCYRVQLDDLDRLFDTVKRKGKIDVLFASAGKGEAANWARLPSSTSMRPSA
jgi:hypothetical protein